MSEKGFFDLFGWSHQIFHIGIVRVLFYVVLLLLSRRSNQLEDQIRFRASNILNKYTCGFYYCNDLTFTTFITNSLLFHSKAGRINTLLNTQFFIILILSLNVFYFRIK